jgi:hypothetical protein
MQLLIDALSSSSNWTSPNGTLIQEVNWNHLRVNNAGQLILTFPDTGIAELTLPSPVDISPYSILSFVGKSYAVANDNYKIRFYDDTANISIEYIFDALTDYINIDFVNTLSSIDRIQIESTLANILIINNLIAYKQEFPIDIYNALKTYIDGNNVGIPVGSVSCTAGATSISISNYKYIDRYSVIKIGSEYHQIQSGASSGSVTFNSKYSGKSIVSNYTNQTVYMIPDVLIEPTETDIVIPSLALTGGFKYDIDGKQEIQSSVIFSKSTTDLYITPTGEGRIYEINIEGISRDSKVLEYLLDLIKKCFYKNTTIYINNTLCDVDIEKVEYIDYTDANEILPKIFANLKIEIAEELWKVEQTNNFQTTKTVQPI